MVEAFEDSQKVENALSRCRERGDPYARYLAATICFEPDDSADPSVGYVARMGELADGLNPWACADLGMYLLFDEPEDGGRERGQRYLMLGAVFGEKRAQYYFAFEVERDPRFTELARRLYTASARQGYQRALDRLQA